MKLYKLINDDNYKISLKEYGNEIEFNDNIDNSISKFANELDIWDLLFEHQYVLAFNDSMFCLGGMIVSVGNMSECNLYLDNIFRFLLLIGASGFIFIHNHPSGDDIPSESDINVVAPLSA